MKLENNIQISSKQSFSYTFKEQLNTDRIHYIITNSKLLIQDFTQNL